MLRSTWQATAVLGVAILLSVSSVARAQSTADSTTKDDLPSKPTKDDVPKLIKKLRDKDEFIRMKAAKLLGNLGADAADALPELSKLLSNPDIDVRSVASQAMNKIQTALDNKQALDDLQQKLNTALTDKTSLQKQLAAANAASAAATAKTAQALQDASAKAAQRDQHIADLNATIATLKRQLAKKK